MQSERSGRPTVSWLIAGLLALVILVSACALGFVVGQAAGGGVLSALPQVNIGVGRNGTPAAGDTAAPVDRNKLFAPFWQAWDLVHQRYVDQPVNDVKLMRGAIQGMLDSLGDQHTSYMDPTQYESVSSSLSGEYEGIGAWVDITGDYVKIISPMPKSPAARAGLKPDDMIVAVNGEDMTGVDGQVALQKVKGPSGTEVTLTIQRAETAPFDVTLKREAITVPSVEGELRPDGIAYVRVYTFGDDTASDLKLTLQELLAQNPKGMVLDLRNNGGGFLESGIDVTSQFIPDGLLMVEAYGDGERKEFTARSGGLATEIPLVVLINQGSASASEIVAGAIQDRGRGQLVGMTSYGKGSVQIFVPLQDEQGAVRVTIARWLTPNGRTIHGQGLEPDVKVEFTEADLAASKDPQLEAAVKLLLTGK
jgi:carboxyl-terminal processing protease